MSSQTQANQKIPKYKIIFLGDQNAGKSGIINRFMYDTFTDEYQASIGLDFLSKNIHIDNQDIYLLLYDTAGQEKFRALIPIYTRDADIIIFVYNISSKESFNVVSEILKDLTNIKKEEVIFALVGNKPDLDSKREVNLDEAENFAKENGFIFAEVCAKTGDGISELFYHKLIEEIKLKFKSGQKKKSEVKDIKFNILKECNKRSDKKGCI